MQRLLATVAMPAAKDFPNLPAWIVKAVGGSPVRRSRRQWPGNGRAMAGQGPGKGRVVRAAMAA